MWKEKVMFLRCVSILLVVGSVGGLVLSWATSVLPADFRSSLKCFQKFTLWQIYIGTRECAERQKIRRTLKQQDCHFVYFVQKEPRRVRVLCLLMCLGRVAFSINSSVNWGSHGDRFSDFPQSHSSPRVMFVLTEAKILDYSIVPAINLVFPLLKTISSGCTVIILLQKSQQLKPFQKVKN